MNIATASWRNLRRDWRAGELRILAAALVIAVASVSSVGFFTDRTQRALHEQANELLAADLVVLSGSGIDEAWPATARTYGLATARSMTFPSVVRLADTPSPRSRPSRTVIVRGQCASPARRSARDRHPRHPRPARSGWMRVCNPGRARQRRYQSGRGAVPVARCWPMNRIAAATCSTSRAEVLLNYADLPDPAHPRRRARRIA